MSKLRKIRFGKFIAKDYVWAASVAVGVGLLATSLTPAVVGATEVEAQSVQTETPEDFVPFTGDLSRRLGSASRAAEREELEQLEQLIADGATAAIVPAATVGTHMEIRTEIDEYERIERENPNRFNDLPPLTVQYGQNGEVTRVYRYTETDGELVGSPVLEIIAAERQDHIVEIGTRDRPVVVAPPAPTGGGSGGGNSGGSGGWQHGVLVTGRWDESIWRELARCESTNNPRAISPGGRFHGMYQFSPATWRSVGGTGLPSQASWYEQRYRAVRLQARSGWGQWPACTRRMGLR